MNNLSSSNVKQLLSDGFECVKSLKNDLVLRSGSMMSLTSSAVSRRTVDELASSGSVVRAGSGDYSGILKKLISLGIASAAVFGSAFYIGYQLARRRHRFHVREADKNDQVGKCMHFPIPHSSFHVYISLFFTRLSRNSKHTMYMHFL